MAKKPAATKRKAPSKKKAPARKTPGRKARNASPLPDEVRATLPAHVLKMIDRGQMRPLPQGLQIPDITNLPRQPIASVNWDQPWWVAVWWVKSRSSDEKDHGLPGTEKMRWAGPMGESHILGLLDVPAGTTVEQVNENRDMVRPSHAQLAAWGEPGGQPVLAEDVEFQ